MNRYTIVTSWQLVALSILISALVSTLVALNTWWMDNRLLPQVVTDAQGQCLKVNNYENAHAFNCNDVGVLLRRFRKVVGE